MLKLTISTCIVEPYLDLGNELSLLIRQLEDAHSEQLELLRSMEDKYANATNTSDYVLN
jgi:hypothetical protein